MRISSATCSPVRALTSTTATALPSEAKRKAMTRPIPTLRL
jgi:hypothetical protein